MLPLAALGIAALYLYMMSSSKSYGVPSGEAITPALQQRVQEEMKKLYTTNATAYSAVNTLLNVGGNPVLMMQYAMSLQAQYSLSQHVTNMDLMQRQE